MKTNSLNTIPANHWYQTLVALQEAGVTSEHLKKVRKSPGIAHTIRQVICEQIHNYPSGFAPISISEQVKALMQLPGFGRLDPSWALEHGQSWYDDLILPDWVEHPLVYPRSSCINRHRELLWTVLDALSININLKDLVSQLGDTTKAEEQIKCEQQGDFLIVPSQIHTSWQGNTVNQVRLSYRDGEFGHGAIACGSYVAAHPGSVLLWSGLALNCPGGEMKSRYLDKYYNRVPRFGFRNHHVSFSDDRLDNSSLYYRSITGYVPK